MNSTWVDVRRFSVQGELGDRFEIAARETGQTPGAVLTGLLSWYLGEADAPPVRPGDDSSLGAVRDDLIDLLREMSGIQRDNDQAGIRRSAWEEYRPDVERVLGLRPGALEE